MSHSARAAAYRAYLDGHQLRFGFAGELSKLAMRIRRGVRNDTPPDALWPNILPTVELVESVRETFGPTTITSAYRSREYNAVVANSADSRHSHNDAIDFVCERGTPKDWHTFLKGLRDAGRFKGGLGLYRSFVHVDTRGRNADWTG